MEDKVLLIDANALKKYMCKICNDDYSDEPCDPSDCVFRNAIKNAEVIDAAPVIHGRWILRYDGYYCSNCGIGAVYAGVKLNYCPNCGSKND